MNETTCYDDEKEKRKLLHDTLHDLQYAAFINNYY